MNRVPVLLLSLALLMSGCRGCGGGDGSGGMGGATGFGGDAGTAGTSGIGGEAGAGGTAGVGGAGGEGGTAGAGGHGGAGGAAGVAGQGGAGGTAGVAGQGGAGGGGGGGAAGTGGMPENRCPFYTGVLVSPLSQSVSNLIDVDTRVLDLDGDAVDVRVTSDCGEVADPLQTADGETGESSTTVRCDQAGSCSVTVSISDDGFDPKGCDGMNPEATSTTQVDCQ